MKEPRIHFAIVCASASCPDLRREPYEADRLDAQLDDQTKRFLTNPGKGMRVDADEKKIFLSKILDWFDDDFGGRDGVLSFVARNLPRRLALPTGWRSFDIDHFAYDWNLNQL
jgi:hypothetical protein